MMKLPLHLKTALLASAISFAVLLAALIAVSANVAQQIRDDQKELVRLQVEDIAAQLSATGAAIDEEELKNLTNFISGSRPNLVSVRIWKLQDGRFAEQTSSDDSLPAQPLSREITAALLSGNGANEVKPSEAAGSDSYFRVVSPIEKNRNVIGAVEGVEKLDTIASIALRYIGGLSVITLLTVFLMSVAIYLLFRRLVYAPLENLLAAMERAEANEPGADGQDFSDLSDRFGQVIRRIREMAAERELQNEILGAKVEEATAELMRKNDQLESANLELFRNAGRMSQLERLAAAGQTAAQFAHEIGTPLNLISGHVQLLRSALAPGSPDDERLRTIESQIERIERSVREMLDETRFGDSEHVPIDLNEAIRTAAEAVEPTLADHGVRLHIELDHELPPISGDHDRLLQVLFNLFKNSLDAISGAGTITVRTFVDTGRVAMEFADDGCGMDEETKKHIFNPMFTTKSRGMGSGIGLFVVRQILKEHGASVKVESAPGSGTKFLITFDAV